MCKIKKVNRTEPERFGSSGAPETVGNERHGEPRSDCDTVEDIRLTFILDEPVDGDLMKKETKNPQNKRKRKSEPVTETGSRRFPSRFIANEKEVEQRGRLRCQLESPPSRMEVLLESNKDPNFANFFFFSPRSRPRAGSIKN